VRLGELISHTDGYVWFEDAIFDYVDDGIRQCVDSNALKMNILCLGDSILGNDGEIVEYLSEFTGANVINGAFGGTSVSPRTSTTDKYYPLDGENLITASDCPVFGGVYKLVAVKGEEGWEPRMKCSNTLEKAIIPGYKMVYRLYDEEGRGYLDLIAMHDEVIEIGKPIKVYTTDLNDPIKEYTITPKVVKPLLVPYIENGELVRDMPILQETRDYIKNQLENQVWPEELRTSNPHRHFVDMTEKVYKLRTEMYNKLHG
jgi:hypothetical protein